MRKLASLLPIALAALLAGCSYPDMAKPLLRNYASDLLYSQPEVPVTTPATQTTEALVQALARWRAAAGPTKEEYTVGPQDVLAVAVVVPNRSDIASSMQVPVTDQGDLTLPLVGQVHVAGMTATEIGKKLSALYGDGYYRDPDVAVAVTTFASKTILVTGAVAAPQTVTLKQNSITLLEALLDAGGPSKEAGDLVRLTPSEAVRGDAGAAREGAAAGDAKENAPRQAEVKLSDLARDVPAAQNVRVYPGDVVYVPTAPVRIFYVLGFVRVPGPYPMPADGSSIGLLNAIACARGLDDTGLGGDVRLIRQTPDGAQLYPVDLSRVAAAQDPDIPVQPNDVIIVSTSWSRRTVNGILHSVGLRSLAPAY
jgi:polysaccharide export outer membrane protein